MTNIFGYSGGHTSGSVLSTFDYDSNLNDTIVVLPESVPQVFSVSMLLK